MKKVLAKSKLHLYRIFKTLYWLKWYLGFWGFKKFAGLVGVGCTEVEVVKVI